LKASFAMKLFELPQEICCKKCLERFGIYVHHLKCDKLQRNLSSLALQKSIFFHDRM
jgi:hypothetical protein